jgi:hypothetical protein
MTTIKERYNRSYVLTPSSRVNGDMAPSVVTTIPQTLKRPHDNSLVSLTQDLPYRTSNPERNFQTFSASSLKNKTLLVPTRLALKRQRATFRGPTMQFEPIQTDALQMELGNAEELTIHNDQDDDDEHNIITTPIIHLSPEQNRMQSTSNHTSPLRGDTPHTAPTDISLLYRYVTLNILSLCKRISPLNFVFRRLSGALFLLTDKY